MQDGQEGEEEEAGGELVDVRHGLGVSMDACIV